MCCELLFRACILDVGVVHWPARCAVIAVFSDGHRDDHHLRATPVALVVRIVGQVAARVGSSRAISGHGVRAERAGRGVH